MRRSFGTIVAGVTTVAALAALPAAAEAIPDSTTFRVQGIEIAFTSTRATFVGYGRGAAGDHGAWKAVVDHAPLSSRPAAITGGRFKLVTVSPAPTTDVVAGVITGGTIAVINPRPGCANQTFAVSGNVGNVRTRTSSGGSGVFTVRLTHRRARLLGTCVTYAATVTGSASFAY